MKILMVATSHEQLGDTGRKTGLWLEEVAIPYFIFKDAGAVITLASPQGGSIPLDPRSESILATNSTTRRFQRDQEGSEHMSHSVSLHSLNAADFDMIYVAGGHGALWDYPDSDLLKTLLEDFIRSQKIIGLVSHGPAALITIQDVTGQPFVKGRHLTAYSNAEEKVAGLELVIPFSLESRLVASGAIYTKGPDYQAHTVTDGNFVYGQNAASALEVSKQMLVLQKNSFSKAQAEKH